MNRLLNSITNSTETEMRIDGYIVADEDKWIYDWFEYPAVSPKDVIEVLSGLGGKSLTIKINSYGGDVWSGSVIYTALKDYSGQVTVKIDGLAASAASVIAMGGDKILMSPTAQMMIHNASTTVSGDCNDMEQGAKFLKNVNDTIANAYMVKTGMAKDELLKLMNDETWMSVQDAMELGFVDEMMFAEQAAEQVVDSAVVNMLKSKAQNIYQCFNMPSAKSIQELKKILKEPSDGGGNDDSTENKDSKTKALALLEIEKNRF